MQAGFFLLMAPGPPPPLNRHAKYWAAKAASDQSSIYHGRGVCGLTRLHSHAVGYHPTEAFHPDSRLFPLLQPP